MEEARKTAASPISAGFPQLASGDLCDRRFVGRRTFTNYVVSFVSTKPGAIALTRMSSPAHARASDATNERSHLCLPRKRVGRGWR